MFKHLVIYTFFYVCACFAQIVNPVTIDVTSDSLVRAGEVVNIEISAKMEKQWKIYSIYKIVDGPLPTEINIKGDIISEIGKVIEPEPTEEYDPGFDVTSFYHKGNTLFSSQVLLKDDLPPGFEFFGGCLTFLFFFFISKLSESDPDANDDRRCIIDCLHKLR